MKKAMIALFAVLAMAAAIVPVRAAQASCCCGDSCKDCANCTCCCAK